MIFSHSKGMYVAVLSGEKTLTTRIHLPAHIAMDRVEAIVPGRAKPAWWFGEHFQLPGIVTSPRQEFEKLHADGWGWLSSFDEFLIYLQTFNYVQAKIVTRYWWQNRLQDMTVTEAKMEGVATVRDYAALWDRINAESGWRWQDNPLVWRIRFRRTPEVTAAIEKVGLAALQAVAA